MKTALKESCRGRIEVAWPAQQRGETPEKGVERRSAFQQKLVADEPKTRSHELPHTEAMKERNLMPETRRLRLQRIAAGTPPRMGSIVALGSAATYLLVGSLRMPLGGDHCLGSLLFAFLFLIAAMDYHFNGRSRSGRRRLRRRTTKFDRRLTMTKARRDTSLAPKLTHFEIHY
ncbi:MAG: hypothetical protein U0744_21155 [Gemmataceae bacterium]